jgi:hypothetical protein
VQIVNGGGGQQWEKNVVLLARAGGWAYGTRALD